MDKAKVLEIIDAQIMVHGVGVERNKEDIEHFILGCELNKENQIKSSETTLRFNEQIIKVLKSFKNQILAYKETKCKDCSIRETLIRCEKCLKKYSEDVESFGEAILGHLDPEDI